MDSLLIISIFLGIALIGSILYFLNKSRRIHELKEKTTFAVKSETLVKVEFTGSDDVASIAQNFNQLGDKLTHYRKNSDELSNIKTQKQDLDSKVQIFEDSLSQVNLLTDIGRKITACLNIEDISLKLYNYINSSMIAEEINILILKNGKKNYFNAADGKITGILNPEWCNDKDNILNWSYNNNKEAFLNDAVRDFAQYVFKPVKMQNGKVVESVITIPLAISNKMIGAVSVLSSTKNSFSDFHLDFARSIASYVSVAIDNANLYGQLDDEKQKSDKLLLNILPQEVADELKTKGRSEARHYDNVSVLFTDFVNFTGISDKLTPRQLVEEIDYYFKAFDEIMEHHGLEKIKTIGDAYLAVSGLPNENPRHAQSCVNASLDIINFVKKRKAEGGLFEIRIGINSGAVVAGIVGIKKYAYDIWGDSVNLANRMESNSQPGKVNISGATYELVKNDFICTHRGKVEAKNKGLIDMYFVEGINYQVR